MLSNCGAGKDSWEFLGQQGDKISQFKRKSTLNIHWMLKLKLQYLGHLMWRADSLEKTLMLGKIEGRRRKGVREDEMVGWHHWLNGHGLSTFWETVKDREAWCTAVYGVLKNQTQLSNWTIATLPVTTPAHLPHMPPTQLTPLPSQTAWTRVGPPTLQPWLAWQCSKKSRPIGFCGMWIKGEKQKL